MKKFMGLENELSAWTYEDIYKFESFKNHFNKFIKPSDFKKGKLAVRSPEGLAFYVDGEELEINTPPVVVNKGFATRLTDALMIGQNRILQFGDKHGLEFTGYSIHWNISRNKKSLLADDFYQGVAVPFRLFGTTPISTGITLRYYDDNYNDQGSCNKRKIVKRFELLGDSIVSEEQINAACLMLASYSYAFESGQSPLGRIHGTNLYRGKKLDSKFLSKGRKSKIAVCFEDTSNYKTLSAQKYLESFYKWIHLFVKELGTKSEI
ncbi:MAG: hypothetical protein ABIC91_01965 [Nanoarchaeota archaeon]|nr:hypothetical protein [Nanoarchaeota archaeon]MBU1030649.1 hypothetical protein [Nanoarchaeota archaeon]MBU1849851.1 hypothetical protein [Nanoarchaeota archaeon]